MCIRDSYVVVQQFAFALGEFATQADFPLGVADAAHVGKCVRIHQVVPAELVGLFGRKVPKY